MAKTEGLICNLPNDFDKDFVKSCPEARLTPQDVADLRARYEMRMRSKDTFDEKKFIPIENMPKSIGMMLINNELKDKRQTETTAEIKAKGNSRIRSIALLRFKVKADRRNEIIDSIAAAFTEEVDKICDKLKDEGAPYVNRDDITLGLEEEDKNGKIKHSYGEAAILEKVYQRFYNDYVRLFKETNGESEELKIYEDLIKYWPNFVSLARNKIRQTESLLSNDDFTYYEEASLENFFENPEEYDAEINTRESWQQSSEERDPFASIGKRVRRVLATLPEIREQWSTVGEVGKDEKVNLANRVVSTEEVKTKLGTKKYMKASSVHKQLIELCRGTNTAEEMMERIRNGGVWLSSIVKEVDKDPYFATQLFCDLKRNFRYYGSVSKKDNNKGLDINLLNEEKTNIYINKIIGLLTFVPSRLSGASTIFDSNGFIIPEEVKNLRSFIQSNLTDHDITYTDPKSGKERTVKSLSLTKGILNKNQEVIARNAQILQYIFDSLGIQTNITNIEAILRSNKRGIIRQLANEILALSDNALYKLEKGSASTTKYFATFEQDSEGNKSAMMEHMSKIIKILNKYDPSVHKLYKVRTKNDKGKNSDRYSDIVPSFLGNFVEKLNDFGENDDKEGLRNFLEDKFFNDPSFAAINSDYKEGVSKPSDKYIIYNATLRDLWEQTFNGNKTPLNINIRIVENLLTNDVVSENMSEKQHAITQFSYYYSPYAGNGKAYYPVFILGDANKLMYITGKRYKDNDGIFHEFYNLYLREIHRANEMRALNEVVKSQGYEELDWIKKDPEYGHPFGRNEEFSILSILNPILKGRPLSEHKTMSEAEFISVFAPLCQKQSDETKEYFEKIGVFELNTKGDGFKNLEGTELNSKKVKFEDAWFNYFLNNKLAMALQLNILDVDTLFAPNSKELQKRNKQNVAPGNPLNPNETWEGEKSANPEDEYSETIAYFNDISINAEDTNPDFMRAVAKHFGGEKSEVYKKYKKATYTDGQGYRTLTSYRKVMVKAGKWSPELESTYKEIKALGRKIKERENILKNSNKLSFEDLKEAAAKLDAEISEMRNKLMNSATIFQPIKPFTYTHEKIEYATNEVEGRTLVATIPVQVKYAEAVIIPELMEDCTLKTMAEWMDENGVDVMCSTKCVKYGMFASFDLPNTNDMSEEDAKEAIRSTLTSSLKNEDGSNKLGIHRLSYADYRIQTNVPPHTDMTRGIGTQIRKLIMSDLRYGENNRYNYYFDSYENAPILSEDETDDERNNVDAKRLVNIYNSLIICNILDSFDRFEEIISNNKKLAKLLQGVSINTDKTSFDNLIAFGLTQDEKFLIPLFEGQLEHDTISEILSIFRKDVNKQKMRGGSAVQVSAMGIKKFNENDSLKVVVDKNDNPLYAECEIPFDFHYTDEFGNIHELDYDTYCNPDGTFKEDKNGKLLIDVHFPGMRDIIAYRVPTERNYSTINLKVVRCSPKIAGGTIKVPAQYTVTAGFDFDIDKLFFLRKDFTVKNRPVVSQDDSLLSGIWAEIYAGNYQGGRNVLEDLREAQEEAYITKVKKRNPSYVINRNSKAFQNGLRNFGIKNPLYNYWEAVGAPGTRQEAFEAYIEEHPEKLQQLEESKIYATDPALLEWDDYNPDIVPEKQSTMARNNMLLHIMQQRLMDEETIESRYRPGGFDGAKYGARILRELTLNPNVKSLTEAKENIKNKKPDPEPSYDPTDIKTMLIYNQMNQCADKLIGIFANQNINHALASLASTLELKVPIRFNGHIKVGYTDLLHNPDGKDTFRTVAEFLAASVDAVKDPVLNYLNFNTLTANSAGLLARLGYEPEEIGLLFNQPIIKEACEKAQNDGTSLGTAISSIKSVYRNKYKEDVDAVFESDYSMVSSENLASYIIKGRDSKIMDNESLARTQLKILNMFADIVSAADELNDFIKVTRFTAASAVGSTIGDIYEQRQVVEDYLKRIEAKEEKSASMFNIKLGGDNVNDGQNNIPINMHIGLNYKKRKSGKWSVDKTKYLSKVKDNPFAYEQCMYDCIQSLPRMLGQNYPYETALYSGIREAAKKLVVSKKKRLRADTINGLHRELPHYILSHLGNWNPENLISSKNMLYKKTVVDDEGTAIDIAEQGFLTQEEYYKYHFGNDYLKFSLEHGFAEKYPNLDAFIVPTVTTVKAAKLSLDEDGNTIEEETTEKIVALRTASGRGHDIFRQDVKDAIREEIEDMAREFPRAAFGLYFYNYFNLGFTFGGNSFSSLFPVTLLYSLPVYKDRITGEVVHYVDILKGLIGDSDHRTVSKNDYLQQYILNHLDDNSFVYHLNKEAKGEFTDSRKVQRLSVSGNKDSFTLSSEVAEKCEVFNPIMSTYQVGETLIQSWAPVIAISDGEKTTYYMANLGKSDSGSMVFSEAFVSSTGHSMMTYTKVEPAGLTSAETRYTSSIDGTVPVKEIFPVIETEQSDNTDTEYQITNNSDIFEALSVRKNSEGDIIDEVDRRNTELFNQEMTSDEEILDDEGTPIC